MGSPWTVAIVLLLLGIVVGAGNVLMLSRTIKSLRTDKSTGLGNRVIGSYVLRTVLVALVLVLGVRIGSKYALVTFIGILIGGGLSVTHVLGAR